MLSKIKMCHLVSSDIISKTVNITNSNYVRRYGFILDTRYYRTPADISLWFQGRI